MKDVFGVGRDHKLFLYADDIVEKIKKDLNKYNQKNKRACSILLTFPALYPRQDRLTPPQALLVRKA